MSEGPKEPANFPLVRAREWGGLVSLVLREAAGSYSTNGNFGAAATMAYYGFLSLMPLLLLVVFLPSLPPPKSVIANCILFQMKSI